MKIKTERFGNLFRLTCEAPKGFIWNEGYVHELVAETRGNNSKETRLDILSRIQFGLTECINKDCEWCNYER